MEILQRSRGPVCATHTWALWRLHQHVYMCVFFCTVCSRTRPAIFMVRPGSKIGWLRSNSNLNWSPKALNFKASRFTVKSTSRRRSKCGCSTFSPLSVSKENSRTVIEFSGVAAIPKTWKTAIIIDNMGFFWLIRKSGAVQCSWSAPLV